MSYRHIAIALAWWFLVQGGQTGSMSQPKVFTQAGPFKDQTTCNNIAKWAKDQGKWTAVSDCWEGDVARF